MNVSLEEMKERRLDFRCPAGGAEPLSTYLTVHEVAGRLRVSEPTIRRWIAAGRLPATRVGRLLRIKESDLNGLLPEAQRLQDTASRAASVAGLLAAAKRCASIVRPGDVEELERLIEEGCERPGQVGEIFG
jgi:excisionase family DNA binding protein